MTLRDEQCELTMANHGDAYRLILWPHHEPVGDSAKMSFIKDNWEAVYNLVLEGNKHHRGLNISILYNIAVETLIDWCYDKYN